MKDIYNKLAIVLTCLIVFVSSCKEEKINTPPRIINWGYEPFLNYIYLGDTVIFTCNATDEDGDNICYIWNVARGEIINTSSNTMQYVAFSDMEGEDTVTVKITDGIGYDSSRYIPYIHP
jgi:hypothetical protein|tara:strand:+ start:248 stop:607 length:360 start_codon:yes stop_codon:yes gene_type:complete